MSSLPPDAPDTAARDRVRRLIDLVQILVPTMRPAMAVAIERCVLELALDQMRQRISDNVTRLGAEDLATVDALVAQLARPRAIGDEQDGESALP